MKSHYRTYVDDRYIETIYSGWSVQRILRHLERKYPDAQTLEVQAVGTEESSHVIRGEGNSSGNSDIGWDH